MDYDLGACHHPKNVVSIRQAYVDGIQLEKGTVLSAYNLVENSSFERDANTDILPDGWTDSGNLAGPRRRERQCLRGQLIEDPDSQIDKTLVFYLENELIRFGVCYTTPDKYTWYDGEKITTSINDVPPLSERNIVSLEDFVNGTRASLKFFLNEILKRYPTLTNVSAFMYLARKINLHR